MVTGYYPTTLQEATQILELHPDALLISGGTDVMVVKKSAENEVFLNRIEEIKQVEQTENTLRIGAGMTYRELIESDLVPEVLKEAIRGIASPAIRNLGTMAGNICNASPAGDTLPVLYALDAQIILVHSQSGKMHFRKIAIEDFIKGIRKIDLNPGEMVYAIEIEAASYSNLKVTHYQKVGARQSEAISKLSFVGLGKLKEGKVADVRIAFGSVGVTSIRKRDLEKCLIGKSMNEVKEEKAAIVEVYSTYIHPIDDQRSTAVYRKKVCLNLLGAFIEALCEAEAL